MDVLVAISKRKSVRVYKNTPIEESGPRPNFRSRPPGAILVQFAVLAFRRRARCGDPFGAGRYRRLGE